MTKQETTQFDVICPSDLSLIKTLPLHSKDDAEQMMSKAHSLHKDIDNWLNVDERIGILNKLAELVSLEAEEFALLIAQEGGKPLMDARVEVTRAIDGIHLANKELLSIMRGSEIPMGHTAATRGRLAFTTCEPIGVVFAISAFNHPLNLIIHQVVPAIATGCPVIVKPAKMTPLCCLRFCELVQKAGLPESWCQVLLCENSIAEAFVGDKRLAFLSFIGSARVGWYLRSKLAPGVRCALEHGGVAPVIIDDSVDLDSVIPSLLKGGFYHAGQVCVSVQRIFVQDSVARQLADKLADAATKLNVGDASLEETEVGPLIQPSEVERVGVWVEESVAEGAELLCGGKPLGETYYAPTVLFNPDIKSKVCQAEIFGPVVCIIPYTDRLVAIEQANDLDFAFQASVYTENIKMAFDTVKRLDASAVMVNDHTAFRCDWMPFTGRRSSGYGVGGIGYTMKDMIHEKMTVIKTA